MEGYGGGTVQIDSTFADRVPNLDIFEQDWYPYGWHNLTGNFAISGDHFQEVIVDGTLESFYDTVYIFLDGKIPWMAEIQTWASLVPDDAEVDVCECVPDTNAMGDTVSGKWKNWDNFTVGYRLPSREEMRLQAFLAISRGAKGIICFTYGPQIHPYDGSWQGVILGLIDYNYAGVDQRDKWYPYDTEDADEVYTPYAFNYGPDDSPYDHIQELFIELEQIGPTILDLRVTAIGSYGWDQGPDTLKWVAGNASDWVMKLDTLSGDTAQIQYWEVTTFVDTSIIDSTDYFMLVNRVTCHDSVSNDTSKWEPDTSGRGVAVIFTQPSNHYPFVQNIHTSDAMFITEYDSTTAGKYWFTFADTVDPGDGEVYRVTNAYVFNGPVTDSTTISKDIILVGDLVIDTGAALVIEPGVTVLIYPDYDNENHGQSDSTIEIITKGRLYANGTSSDSIRFTPWTNSPEKGDWVGVYLDESAHAEFSYCAIQYGDRGLEMRPNSDASIDHSNISNHSSMGVYNYKGDLDLTNSTIYNSGAYGLYGYYAADSVYNTTFIDNEVYGIKIYSIHTGGDSSYFLYDTVSTSYSPSQSGILVEYNDKVRIEGCKIRSYDYAAIRLNNSDATITDCDLTFNTNHVLYCVSSSPKVRDCLFDSLSIGVYNFMLGTGMADLGKNIEGEYGNNSILDCSSWLIYFAGIQFGSDVDTLFAQMNWWGDPDGPDTEKFYVNDPVYKKISYIPYLGEDPLAKLASQLPLQFSLNQNYPNPFNSNTTILFSLDQPQKTVVTIYNILGQRVATPVDEMLDAGSHSVIWDGRNSSGSPVASGIYFYTIQSGNNFASKKMLLLR